MPDTGYGSATFARACRIVTAYQMVDARGLRAALLRLRAGSPRLMMYRRRLPSVRIDLTDSPAGQMIDQHLSIRKGPHWRYRRAQAVLALPDEFPQYLKGRSRQAVRTNLTRAREAGLTVEHHLVDDWKPGSGDFRADHLSPGPAERWNVTEPDGRIVAQAILTVDEDVALLHGLISYVTHARWLLHTAMVERLCGSCRLLLVNSDEVYLLAPGTLHFQRLLGYDIARLQVKSSPAPARVESPSPIDRRNVDPPSEPLSA